jgi:hypothetical protein
MEALDGIRTPDREITDEEFEAAGGFARLSDGEIFFGKTDAEKTAQANTERVRFPQIPACKHGLYRREDCRRFGDR